MTKQPLTQEQIIMVKNSWNLLHDVDPAYIGDVFYSRLFLVDPSLEKMFTSPMKDQYRKLISMLTLIVSRLERLSEIENEVKGLATRHVKYGVKPWHYELVGETLLWTLEKGLGNDWNEEVKQAWFNAFSVLSTAMIQSTEREKEAA